jgi:hypothetical protein
MAITLRSVKGTPLTNAELDGNFTDLNNQIALKADLNGNAGQNFNMASLNGGALSGMNNRIINGDMAVDQRYAGTLITVPAQSFQYTADRWQVGNNRNSGAMTVQRVVRSAPSVSANPYALRITVSTGNALAAGDNTNLTQCIEGLNIADFAWGTANAKPLTLAFCVTASIAGNYAIAVRNASVNRCYVAHFNVASAGVEQLCSVTIPGETTGSWNSDTGPGAYVSFDLGIGSTYNTASLNTWVTSGNVFGSTTSVKLSTVTGATFEITNIRAVAGSVVVPMESMPFSVKLALCQRYFAKTFAQGVAVGNNKGTTGALFIGPTSTAAYWSARWEFPVTMRTTPTVNCYNPDVGTVGYWRDAGNASDIPATPLATSDKAVQILLGTGGPYTPAASSAIYLQVTAAAEF